MVRYVPVWAGKQLTFFGIVVECILVKITLGSFGLVPDTWKIDSTCQLMPIPLAATSAGLACLQSSHRCSLGFSACP